MSADRDHTRTQLLIEMPGAAPSAVVLPGLRLVVTKGVAEDKGRSRSLDKDDIVIGTGGSCDLQLTDATVSCHHLRLRIDERGVLATDLGSTNGSRVEGRRFDAAWLAPRDRLELGATQLRLEAKGGAVNLPLAGAEQFGPLIGRSVAMRRLFALLEQAAPSDATVLISGETGSGKDVVAQAIHEASRRSAGPFMVTDCSALVEGLVESELFGHEKGAFTGADRQHRGSFIAAHGGTLFLDEIGELPRALQPKLLRVLEQREVRPVGATKPIPIDVRIIAATNRDLRLDVNRGLFREDLFYRLNVIAVTVPPLRDRGEDVALLAAHFWRQLGDDAAGPCPEELLQASRRHIWPGNVRELRNRVERALVLGKRELSGIHERETRSYGDAREAALSTFELAFLTELLARSDENVSQAARLAKMDRVYLTKLLRKHALR